MIPEQDRNSLSAKWLINKVEVLSHQIIGAECPGFTFIDSNGKSVSLKRLPWKNCRTGFLCFLVWSLPQRDAQYADNI